MIELVTHGSPWGGSLSESVDAYKVWLGVNAPGHLAGFTARLGGDPEAARAEAAVFSLCRSLNLDPFPAEDPGTGGADFISRGTPQPIVVEVTALRADNVALKSGLPKELNPDTAQAFSQITLALHSKVKSKASQLGNQTGATVLAICLQHDYADLLMGTLAARWLMGGQPHIRVPLDGSDSDSVTALRESAFFKFSAGGAAVEPCRQSISAVLLIDLRENTLSVVGLLHPAPTVPLDYQLLFPIPFLEVTNWPLSPGAGIQAEWRVPPEDPAPKLFIYCPPHLSETELRGE